MIRTTDRIETMTLQQKGERKATERARLEVKHSLQQEQVQLQKVILQVMKTIVNQKVMYPVNRLSFLLQVHHNL